jgi:Holliday junction resolvase
MVARAPLDRRAGYPTLGVRQTLYGRDMATREKQVQDGIIRYLKANGAWYTKVHQAGYGRKGIPDILACYRGVFFGIEVKNEVGKPSDDQIRELHSIRAAGGIAVIARGVSDVRCFLDAINRTTFVDDTTHGYDHAVTGSRVSDVVQQPELPPVKKVVI